MKRTLGILGFILLIGGSGLGQAQDAGSPLRFAMQRDETGSIVQMLAYALDTQTSQIIWQGSAATNGSPPCDQVGSDTALIPLADGSMLRFNPTSDPLLINPPDDWIQRYFTYYDGSPLGWNLIESSGPYAVYFLTFQPLYKVEGITIVINLSTGAITPLLDELAPAAGGRPVFSRWAVYSLPEHQQHLRTGPRVGGKTLAKHRIPGC